LQYIFPFWGHTRKRQHCMKVTSPFNHFPLQEFERKKEKYKTNRN